MIVTEKQQQTKQNKSNCISKCSRTFGKWHPLAICTTYNYRQSKGKPLWGKPASSGTETNLAAKFILRLSALITCLSSHVHRSNNPLICTEITAALTHTERAWLPLSPALAAGCGHDTSRRPQPTQCPCVQEDEAGAITNLQLQRRRPNGWTCTDTVLHKMSSSADSRMKCVANSGTAEHQALRQQKGKPDKTATVILQTSWTLSAATIKKMKKLKIRHAEEEKRLIHILICVANRKKNRLNHSLMHRFVLEAGAPPLPSPPPPPPPPPPQEKRKKLIQIPMHLSACEIKTKFIHSWMHRCAKQRRKRVEG